MAITTTETMKSGSRGEWCSKCKQRKLLLRETVAGLVCADCDPHADTSPVRIVSGPTDEPEQGAD
jgi:hypothetical protein